MGPSLIFDKSTLEGLNADQAMWLDNFFISNIVPTFFIETLADLEKEIKSGRTPEEVVGSLAYRTPDESSVPNAHHSTLLEGELLGLGEIDMETGRPVISGGEVKELGGKTGVIIQPSPEQEALSRWQKHQFLELERLRAKIWRKALFNLDLEKTYNLYQIFFPIGKPKTLADVKKMVDLQIDVPDQEKVLTFGLNLIGLTRRAQVAVLQRWRDSGKPVVRQFAPYFTHVVSVDLFFYLAIAADLIGRGRPSHKVDLSYLYYLPFCMVFSSNDKLHLSIAPLFLRDDQVFVTGTELKDELAKLDSYYDAFPDDVKKRGVMSFAFYPPDETTFLVTRLWDRFMRTGWRKNKINPKPQPDSALGKEVTERIRRLKEEGAPVYTAERGQSDSADEMIVEKLVLAKKGKWTRFPPEVINRKKNEKGEWEDINPSQSA